MPRRLAGVLEESRDQGFLGPGPIDEHVAHARALLACWSGPWQRALDLGSGGGLPGLVIAIEHPDREVVLLDGAQRRTDFLRWAVAELELPRCSVITERAEVAGRSEELRGTFDLVVARSFGAPSATAECAAPMLRVGGQLVVSEPPTPSADRWPDEGLAVLGLQLEERVEGPPRFVRMQQVAPCPERYPRRTGIPGRRLLFGA